MKKFIIISYLIHVFLFLFNMDSREKFSEKRDSHIKVNFVKIIEKFAEQDELHNGEKESYVHIREEQIEAPQEFETNKNETDHLEKNKSIAIQEKISSDIVKEFKKNDEIQDQLIRYETNKHSIDKQEKKQSELDIDQSNEKTYSEKRLRNAGKITKFRNFLHDYLNNGSESLELKNVIAIGINEEKAEEQKKSVKKSEQKSWNEVKIVDMDNEELIFVVLKFTPPNYPKEAIRIGLKKDVVIEAEFLVNEHGQIVDIYINSKFTGYKSMGFEREVINSIHAFKFSDFLYRGEKVSVRFYKIYNFTGTLSSTPR